MNFTLCISFHYLFDVFLLISCHGKLLWSFAYVIIYSVGAAVTTLMSISDGLDPYVSCRKIEKTRSIKEKLDGVLIISLQNRHFSFIDNMMKVLFLLYTLIWRVNNYAFLQGKGINRRNELLSSFHKFVALWYCTHLLKPLTVFSLLKLFPHNRKISKFLF